MSKRMIEKINNTRVREWKRGSGFLLCKAERGWEKEGE